MTLSRFSGIAARIILLAVALVLINYGCGRKHDIISNELSGESPIITVSLNKSEDISTPTAGINAVINVRSGRAGIEKVIYSISGKTQTTDTLCHSSEPMALSESIVIPNDIELAKDSSLTLHIIAIDEDGLISTFEHIFYPIDVQSPAISISYDNSHGYAPNDTVMVHVTASDNTALYYIALSTAGAFTWNDTLRFSMPYPATVDTMIPVPIPLTTYLNFEFWITAEAVDVNFNSATASPEEEITIVIEGGPIVEIHPVGGSKWVSRGDSLRFWIVGYNNTPLKSLGYLLEYGRNEIWYSIDFRDSLTGDFNNIDSAYFAYLVPNTIYCENDLYVNPFTYDHLGHYTNIRDCFMVEGRIRFSQAATFTTPGTTNSYCQLLVDDRRNLVYLGTSYKPWINVYSQTTRQFLDPIDLPLRANGLCLSPDTNSILVIHPVDYKISIVNIDASVPHVDTTIELPGLPWDITALSDGTALIKLLHMEDPPQLLRLNLTDFSIDFVDLGTAVPERVVASGNSEYAVISAFDQNAGNRVLFMYQSGVGIISSRIIDWMVNNGVANYDGSRFAFAGWDLDTKVGIFNTDLSLIGSISANPCHATIWPTAFSRDDRDLYLSYGWFFGLFETEPWSIEGFYHMNSHPDSQQNMVYFATNATDDRLFITSQNGGAADYFFYDIPVDPR